MPRGTHDERLAVLGNIDVEDPDLNHELSQHITYVAQRNGMEARAKIYAERQQILNMVFVLSTVYG